MKITYDVIVCGAGIIGVALARELKQTNQKLSILVIEKELEAGLHASGRNSGVLHAGFYYSPDSLKAKFCKEGNLAIKQICDRHKIPIRHTGKIVVTKNKEEDVRLVSLYNRGLENKVPLELFERSQLNKIEPLAVTNEIFLWSPSTSVTNPKLVLSAMQNEAKDIGVEFLFGIKSFKLLGENQIVTGEGKFEFKHFINAAGSHADNIAKMFDVKHEFEILPFIGRYISVKEVKLKLNTLVYPVPHKSNPFLGVHFTLTSDGETKIGPTAFLTLGRESYSIFNGMKDLSSSLEIAQTFSKYFRHHIVDTSALILDELVKMNTRMLVKNAAQLVPTALEVKGWKSRKPGIRAQLYNKKTNDFETDFVVRRGDNSTHLLNIVSPGWTSSIPFAKWVIENEVLPSL
jgi:L-2-hydroxyglutarate oxidase